MQVEQELAGFAQDRDSLVTIGVFDGVHLGHKYLISKLKELANQQSLRPIAITFNQHPHEILKPHSKPLFLTDAAEKAALLKNAGVETVIVLTFTLELSHLSARDFVLLLIKCLRMKGLVIGPDFALGKNVEGNIATIRRLGQELGFSVTVIPPVRMNEDIISSTAIRQAMADGNMQKVQQFMGRPFSLHGRVVHGQGRGAALGFPTVNLKILPGQALPSDGVYATLASVDGKTYPSVTNVGMNPTFGNRTRTIESFLFDYHASIYEHEVKIDFIDKIRNEIKFDNPDALTRQIAQDILHSKSILNLEAITKNERP